MIFAFATAYILMGWLLWEHAFKRHPDRLNDGGVFKNMAYVILAPTLMPIFIIMKLLRSKQ